MSNYLFGSTLYPTFDSMLDGIIIEYMTAGGMNWPDTIKQFLDDQTDEELVDDLIEGWFPPHDEDCQIEGVNKDALLKAMAEYRRNFTYEHVLINERWRRYDSVVNLMDDEIREELNSHAAVFWHPQMFTDEYCRIHKEKLGEDFDIS
jgi:hypothetical protein